jgi:hypothetical protein
LRVQTRLSYRLGGFLLVAALAACSGGGSVTTAPVPPPTSSGATTMTSTTASVGMPATVAGSITTNAIVPKASVAAAITESTSVAAPGGISPLSVLRIAQAKRTGQAASGPTPILYVQFTSAVSITLSGTPTLNFVLPSVDPTLSYYLAMDSTNGWVAPFAGPATVTGTTLVFASTPTPITIDPSTPLTFALYSIATPTPTPSPTPTPVPTPTPTPVPAPVASPNVLTFDASNPSSQTFAVTETGYTGTFSAALGTCAAATPPPTGGIATPTPFPYPTASGATPTPVPTTFIAQVSPASASSTFTVLSGGQAGTCSVTITDSKSSTTTVTVNVDQANIGIYSTNRATR